LVTTTLILALRNDRFDAMTPEPLANPLITVPFVSSHPSGPAPGTTQGLRDTNGIENRFKLGRVMTLTSRDVHGSGQAMAISNQMDVGAKATARPA
jgi:hypothetical protein